LDGQEVAIKTIRTEVAPSEREVKRFLRETEILARLWHPNIVRFYEAQLHGDRLYFVMEYVAGTDSQRLLKGRGPLPVGLAVGLVCQALYGLHYAHDQGFVHRDIKPANLLVSETKGRVACKLADFGLARAYQDSAFSGITMLGDLGGTPAYMPPEQITDYRGVGTAADQYSAAATLYRLLTGQYAFEFGKDSSQKRLMKVIFEDPIPIQARRPDLPAPLARAIHRALAKQPEERFDDMAGFHSALMPFAAE
jgi:serine/threonine-protein kinase